MPNRAGFGLVGALEEVGHGVHRRHCGAQHHRIDEHSDQFRCRRLVSARHSRADRDLIDLRPPRQHDRQRRVHHSERCDAAISREAPDARRELGIDDCIDVAARPGRQVRPRTIGGKHQQIGHVRELGLPERQALGGTFGRRLQLAEECALPDGEIGVLDLQGFEVGLRAVTKVRVADHQVADQRL